MADVPAEPSRQSSASINVGWTYEPVQEATVLQSTVE